MKQGGHLGPSLWSCMTKLVKKLWPRPAKLNYKQSTMGMELFSQQNSMAHTCAASIHCFESPGIWYVVRNGSIESRMRLSRLEIVQSNTKPHNSPYASYLMSWSLAEHFKVPASNAQNCICSSNIPCRKIYCGGLIKLSNPSKTKLNMLQYWPYLDRKVVH